MSARHDRKITAQMSAAEIGRRDRRIARAVRDGLSLNKARQRFKMSEDTVRAICAAMGVAVPKGGERRE